MIFLGDPANQLLPCQDTCFDKDLSSDISESAMLKSAVGNKRLVLTECKRSDEVLFRWYSPMSAPLEELLEKARIDFPAKVSADYHLCLNHNTRKRVNKLVQRQRTRRGASLKLAGKPPQGQTMIIQKGARLICRLETCKHQCGIRSF